MSSYESSSKPSREKAQVLSSIHISRAFQEEKNWHIPPSVQASFKNKTTLKNSSAKSLYLDFLEKGNFEASRESISHPLTRDLKLTFQGISSLLSPCKLLVLSYQKQRRTSTIKISLGEEKAVALPHGTDSIRVTLQLGAYETIEIEKITLEAPFYKKLSPYLYGQ